jgi:outer membrane protein TolC
MRVVILILVTVVSFSSFSQSFEAYETTKSIDLPAVLQLAGANNLTIQEYQLRQELTDANLQLMQEWWLPNVYAGISAHQLWGSAMNGNGVFFTDVNRQNLWGGLGINGNWDFGTSIHQVNALKAHQKASGYQTQIEKNHVLLESIEAYYDFLTAQLSEKAYQELTDQAKNLSSQIKSQVDAGLKVESDYLLAQSNTSHLNIQKIKAQREALEAELKLKALLNLNMNIDLVAIDSVLVPIQLTGMAENITSQHIINARPEISQRTLSLMALEQEKKTTTSGLYAPTLQLNTYTSYFGDIVSPLYPTSAINVSLLWDINVGRALKGGQVAQYRAQIAIQENRLEQTKAHISAEVTAAQQSKEFANKSAALALKGSAFAKKALDQAMARQKLGTAIPYELLQAQEMYIQLKIDYLKACAEHNKAEYQYFVAAGGVL